MCSWFTCKAFCLLIFREDVSFSWLVIIALEYSHLILGIYTPFLQDVGILFEPIGDIISCSPHPRLTGIQGLITAVDFLLQDQNRLSCAKSHLQMMLQNIQNTGSKICRLLSYCCQQFTDVVTLCLTSWREGRHWGKAVSPFSWLVFLPFGKKPIYKKASSSSLAQG